ncbi:ATP-binding protein [Caldifermentibacillus hisashii]|uniref:ATP-binding protein n=1 Tax=Caldifermentibacillus hisashii TaxID=996558 RepID=UPI003CC74AD6
MEKLTIYKEIHRLRNEGFSNSAIARKLNISRNRVIEYGKMTPDFIYEMYDKAAFILTSNKGPGEWGKFLGDSTLTTAILDRLLHRSEILTFSEEQDSIRMKYRKTIFDPQEPQIIKKEDE